ncbi:MAG: response regulator [Bacteroidota bacterium]
MNTPIKLATIEDEDGWQYLIKKKVEKDAIFKVVLSCKCGNDFFEKYNSSHQLDFVLLDINLPYTPGIEVAKRIMLDFPKLPIIVFTSSNHRSDRQGFASLGIKYYLSKARNKFLQEDLKIIMGLENCKFKNRYKFVPYHHLSFIELVCKGKTNSEIAEILNINLRKVEYQQRIICNHYQLQNSKLALMDFARSFDIL